MILLPHYYFLREQNFRMIADIIETKKFIIEVEEGKTPNCEKCPFLAPLGLCNGAPVPLDCLKVNLLTMKIKEMED